MKNKKTSDLTKRPKIYKDTYWGNHNELDNCASSEIINNRNIFIDKFNISKVKWSRGSVTIREICGSTFDHPECYITKNKEYVMLYSSYEDRIDKTIKFFGFKLYDKMYHEKASTYIAYFKDLNHINDLVKKYRGKK